MEPGHKETLLVCIGPSPTSAEVVRDSGRIAAALDARWIAANVETSQTRGVDAVDHGTLMRNIWLAERSGAEVVSLSGDDVVQEILGYARSQGVTRIVIGRSRESRWAFPWRRTIVSRLSRLGGDMDVWVVEGATKRAKSVTRTEVIRRRWAGYAGAVGAVAAASLVALALQEAGLSEANKAVVFIPAVIVTATWWRLGPGLLAAVLSVLCFDFFFVPPYMTLAVRDIEYLITLIVLAAVAVLVGTLAARLRKQVERARQRERRLEVLYRLGQALAGVSGVAALSETAARELSGTFGGGVTVYLPAADGALEPSGPHGRQGPSEGQKAAAWAYEHGELAGCGTNELSGAGVLCLPMVTPQGILGVLAVECPTGDAVVSLENRQLLETAATHIGMAIERHLLAERSRWAALEADTERVRSSLLSSVSHDLRTPLAIISGASSTLLELGEGADGATKRELLGEIYEESDRLARLVENLLAMTRLESGVITVDKQWFPLEDVLGSALVRLRKGRQDRIVNKHLPPDLPLVPLDGVLIEQVLFNLVDNALEYSPAEAPVDIWVNAAHGKVIIEVRDQGPGLARDETESVFEKLYRGTASVGRARGAGLGLAIARAIVSVHGGEIWAANRPEGGAVFGFSLPLEPVPAGLQLDDEAGVEEVERS